ncbi:MAG: Dephospho-CoA kinase [Gammaproteobacteria bacterium]|nr:Dephospho-CoA kinase [Gammaproteobacteria bacterium]
MLKIGLTGGIGSGKTAVSDRFEALGVPVIDTDVLAREVVEPGEPALDELVATFGLEILQDDGRLNREHLRALVFTVPQAKQRVEAILHPAIRERLRVRLAELDAVYCVIVVPLLVETNFQEMVDRVLVVETPREQCIRWVMERNGMARRTVEQIMESQARSGERLHVAHDIIYNNGSLDELKAKVDRLHARYPMVP